MLLLSLTFYKHNRPNILIDQITLILKDTDLAVSLIL